MDTSHNEIINAVLSNNTGGNKRRMRNNRFNKNKINTSTQENKENLFQVGNSENIDPNLPSSSTAKLNLNSIGEEVTTCSSNLPTNSYKNLEPSDPAINCIQENYHTLQHSTNSPKIPKLQKSLSQRIRRDTPCEDRDNPFTRGTNSPDKRSKLDEDSRNLEDFEEEEATSGRNFEHLRDRVQTTNSNSISEFLTEESITQNTETIPVSSTFHTESYIPDDSHISTFKPGIGLSSTTNNLCMAAQDDSSNSVKNRISAYENSIYKDSNGAVNNSLTPSKHFGMHSTTYDETAYDSNNQTQVYSLNNAQPQTNSGDEFRYSRMMTKSDQTIPEITKLEDSSPAKTTTTTTTHTLDTVDTLGTTETLATEHDPNPNNQDETLTEDIWKKINPDESSITIGPPKRSYQHQYYLKNKEMASHEENSDQGDSCSDGGDAGQNFDETAVGDLFTVEDCDVTSNATSNTTPSDRTEDSTPQRISKPPVPSRDHKPRNLYPEEVNSETGHIHFQADNSEKPDRRHFLAAEPGHDPQNYKFISPIVKDQNETSKFESDDTASLMSVASTRSINALTTTITPKATKTYGYDPVTQQSTLSNAVTPKRTQIQQQNLDTKSIASTQYAAYSFTRNDGKIYEIAVADKRASYEKLVEDQTKIRLQCCKSIEAASEEINKNSASRNIHQLKEIKLEAERHLLIAQQSRFALKACLRQLDLEHISNAKTQPKLVNEVVITYPSGHQEAYNAPFKTYLKISEFSLKLKHERSFTRQSYAVITCYNMNQPESLKKTTTEVISLHGIPTLNVQNLKTNKYEEILPIILKKPFMFHNLTPNFKLQMNLWIYEAEPLFDENIPNFDRNSPVNFPNQPFQHHTPGGSSYRQSHNSGEMLPLPGNEHRPVPKSASKATKFRSNFARNNSGGDNKNAKNNTPTIRQSLASNNSQSSRLSGDSALSSISSKNISKKSIKHKISNIFGALGGHKFKESKSLAPGEYKTEYKSSCFRYHGEVMIDKNTFKVCYDELKGQDEYILHKVCLQNTPSEALLNNEIIIKTQFVEEINHEIEQLPCEGYINVFLPAVPPRWDYYWGEIQAKSIILKKKYDDPAICKTIELTDFYDVEITNRSISSRPNTIRLKQNGCDDNVSLSKTLIHFDTSEMMKMWLTQLKILLEFENNWKCS